MFSRIAALTFVCTCALPLFASAATLTIDPPAIQQGEPALVKVVNSTSTVAAAIFNGKPIQFYRWKNAEQAFIAVDLRDTPGTYPLDVVLATGEMLHLNVVIEARPHVVTPFSIPKKLAEAYDSNVASALLASLDRENAQINALGSISQPLWGEAFTYPVRDPVVTDVYGYLRKTGRVAIAHKGTDFHAPKGTDVVSANRGKVALAKTFKEYGKTVIVDHGGGVMTLYMHLSKILVRTGEAVDRGQLLGLSGATGYANHAHLHFTVRVEGVSIDPISFFQLFDASLATSTSNH